MLHRNQSAVLVALLASTGAGVAQSWAQKLWPTAPAPSFRYAPIVHDTARGRTVWYGGSLDEFPDAQTVAIDEHWEFDGEVWVQAQPCQMPPARFQHAMCYDSLRQRILMFGGRDVPFVDRNDLWSFKDGTWTQLQPTSSPPGRRSAAMTYDSGRDRVVLFGGVGSVYYDDTWEFDGTDWQQVAVSGPTVRDQAAMAFDPIRARSVMTGGNNPGQGGLDITWEFDGQSWVAGGSIQNVDHLAFDPNVGRVVSRTSEWHGSSWQPTAIAAPLSAREGLVYDHRLQTRLAFERVHTTALLGSYALSPSGWLPTDKPVPRRWIYDPIRQRMLAIGIAGSGNTASWDGHDLTVIPGSDITTVTPLNQLTFDSQRDVILTQGIGGLRRVDGSTLQQLPPLPTPYGRPGSIEGSIVYDANRDHYVVATRYSPQPFSQPFVFQTWEYDGSAWQQIQTATVPPDVSLPALVFDPVRQKVVMTGGVRGFFQVLNETWEYDGVDWQQIATSNHPTHTSFRVDLAFDSARSLVVTQAGNDTWIYDGIDWQVESSTPPLAPFRHASAFDPVRNRIVGSGGGVFEYGLADLPTVVSFGTPCQNSSETMVLTEENAPTLGTTMRMRLTGLPPEPGLALILTGFDDQQSGGVPLPIALPSVGGPSGCELALDPAFTNASLHLGSTTTFSFALPTSSAFVGVVYFQQGAVLDTLLNVPLPIATSNALRCTAGL